MEAGVSENNIVIIGIMVFLVKLVVPIAMTKTTSSTKSMDIYMQCIPYRYFKHTFYKIYASRFIMINHNKCFKFLIRCYLYRINNNTINIESDI